MKEDQGKYQADKQKKADKNENRNLAECAPAALPDMGFQESSGTVGNRHKKKTSRHSAT
jgi:hypothetical protein